MKRKIYQHPFLIMSGLYIGAFVGMYSETSLNIALPELSKTFGLPISTIQLLVVGYMMIIGIVLPFASLLMKTFKVKTLTLFSLTSFFIGSILSASAPNFGLLLTGRMIQGIGTGLILPILFALTMEVFPIQKLGAAEYVFRDWVSYSWAYPFLLCTFTTKTGGNDARNHSRK